MERESSAIVRVPASAVPSESLACPQTDVPTANERNPSRVDFAQLAASPISIRSATRWRLSPKQVEGWQLATAREARCGAQLQLRADHTARARKGPSLVHAKVIRPYSHSHSDDERLYKTPEERQLESQRDPIPLLAQFLKAESLATEQELEALRREVEAQVADAADRALKAPKPPRETAGLWVYAQPVRCARSASPLPPSRR